jgi:hypothetical protein
MLRRLCFVLFVCACGARTELYALDAGEADATPSHDASGDVHDASASDVTDAPIIDDVTSGCDGGVTAYLWDVAGELYTFDPTTLATSAIGQVTCPTNAQPWTFSVSRAGYALMIYEDWKIYHVDLATLACTPTSFTQSAIGFTGDEAIAISRDPNTPEQLYIYGVSGGTPTLAVADPIALVPTTVGPVKASTELFPADMQGDALGHLFVLGEQGHFLELDSKTAAVLVDVQTAFSAGDWAVMTYGNSVFFFGDGEVSLEDVANDTLTLIGNTGVPVVGASAAPCTQ